MFEINVKIKGSDAVKILIGNSQHQGSRPYQEDSFGFSDLSQDVVINRGFIGIVADGMGGLNDSRQVSSYAVKTFTEEFQAFDFSKPIAIWLSEVAQSISSAAASFGIGGGSTLSALLCHTSGVYWCNTGDSRIYLFRRKRLYQVTEDFDYFTTLLGNVMKNEMTYNDADSEERKTALTQYIGQDSSLSTEVNIRPFTPEAGDVFLLCSDGVYNALEESEISRILGSDPQNAADNIVKKVLGKGYPNQDNFTSVVLKFT